MQPPTKVVGRRVGAFLIDTAIIIVLTVIAWFILTKQFDGPCAGTGGGVEINGDCRGFEAGSSNRSIWFLLQFLIPFAIYCVMTGITGKTPGKAMVGIKVVGEEGNPPGVWRAFVRWLLVLVDGFPYIIPYLVGFITALNSQRNQRVGDMAANTFVVDASYAGAVPPPGQVAAGPQQFSPTSGWSAPPTGAPVSQQPPPPGAQQQQQADWYPDPHGQARLRYWDGQRWTEHTSA
jgi:uncharacterized RDD family membrane protein YckC